MRVCRATGQSASDKRKSLVVQCPTLDEPCLQLAVQLLPRRLEKSGTTVFRQSIPGQLRTRVRCRSSFVCEKLACVRIGRNSLLARGAGSLPHRRPASWTSALGPGSVGRVPSSFTSLFSSLFLLFSYNRPILGLPASMLQGLPDCLLYDSTKDICDGWSATWQP